MFTWCLESEAVCFRMVYWLMFHFCTFGVILDTFGERRNEGI